MGFFAFIAFVVLVISIINMMNWKNKKQQQALMHPTPMPYTCPKCGSTNINVTQMGMRNVGACQCGNRFFIVSEHDIQTERNLIEYKYNTHLSACKISGIFFAFLFIVSIIIKTDPTPNTTQTKEVVEEPTSVVEEPTTEVEEEIEVSTEDTDTVDAINENIDYVEEIKKLEEEGYQYVDAAELAMFSRYYEGMQVYTIVKLENVYGVEGRSDYFDNEGYVIFEWEKTQGHNIDLMDDDSIYENTDLVIYGTIGENGRIEESLILCDAEDDVNAVKNYTISYAEQYSMEEDIANKFAVDAEEFKNACEEVTYDAFKHNPDLYKSKKIKMKVKVTRVDADGWIMQGTQLAIMEGNKSKEIAIADDRAVRNPRFVENETVTLYGYGDGVRTMKGAGVGGTLSDVWTGDKGYELPCISVLYTDNDNYDDWATIIRNGDNDSHISR